MNSHLDGSKDESHDILQSLTARYPQFIGRDFLNQKYLALNSPDPETRLAGAAAVLVSIRQRYLASKRFSGDDIELLDHIQEHFDELWSEVGVLRLLAKVGKSSVN